MVISSTPRTALKIYWELRTWWTFSRTMKMSSISIPCRMSLLFFSSCHGHEVFTSLFTADMNTCGGIMHFDETRAGRSRYSKQDPLFCGLTIWYMCKSERNVSSMKSMCKSTWTLLVTHPKPPTPNPAYKPSKSQEMPNKHGRFSCRSNYQVHPDRIQK